MARWIPGQSGNPAGRPKKGESLAEALRERLASDGGKALEAIADRLVSLAAEGSIPAMKLILERVDGPVLKSADDGGPVAIQVVFEDEKDARQTLAELNDEKQEKTGT